MLERPLAARGLAAEGGPPVAVQAGREGLTVELVTADGRLLRASADELLEMSSAEAATLWLLAVRLPITDASVSTAWLKSRRRPS